MSGIPPDAVSLELEVPLHDVDALSVVWHGRYFEYFDRARTLLFRSRNLDVGTLADLRFRMLVVDAGCRFISPLLYGDRFRVSSWFTELEPRIRVAHSLWNLTRNRRAARAHTVLVTTDEEGKLLWRTPPRIRDRLAAGGVSHATAGRK